MLLLVVLLDYTSSWPNLSLSCSGLHWQRFFKGWGSWGCDWFLTAAPASKSYYTWSFTMIAAFFFLQCSHRSNRPLVFKMVFASKAVFSSLVSFSSRPFSARCLRLSMPGYFQYKCCCHLGNLNNDFPLWHLSTPTTKPFGSLLCSKFSGTRNLTIKSNSGP